MTHLSGDGLPMVGELSTFNATEYYSPDRRFILGAVTHYDEPGVWVYEISPYDTADAEMIATAYRLIRDNSFFGAELLFHPTSTTIEKLIPLLPEDVKIITTDELYAGIDYQPLNLGTSTGLLRFHTREEVDGQYTPYRELVVLDGVPNDISIVAGIITAEFQTPLAHINVLSANRGTPNMGLRDAQQNEQLVALQDKWVELTVAPFEWTIKEITEEEADAWWDEHRPDPLVVPPMDTSVSELTMNLDILDLENDMADEIHAAIPVFGAKGTNYAALEEAELAGMAIPIQNGFGIPMYYYDQFMTDNLFYDRIQELMADKNWADPGVALRRARGLPGRDPRRDRRPHLRRSGPREGHRPLAGRERTLPVEHELRGPRRLHRSGPLRLGNRRPERRAERERFDRVGDQEGVRRRVGSARLRGARVLQHEPLRRRHGAALHAELPRRRGERRRDHEQHLRHERARARLLRERAGRRRLRGPPGRGRSSPTRTSSTSTQRASPSCTSSTRRRCPRATPC